MAELNCFGCKYASTRSNCQYTIDFYYCKYSGRKRYTGYRLPLSRFGVEAPEWCPLRKEKKHE